jgi:hypothetical protein
MDIWKKNLCNARNIRIVLTIILLFGYGSFFLKKWSIPYDGIVFTLWYIPQDDTYQLFYADPATSFTEEKSIKKNIIKKDFTTQIPFDLPHITRNTNIRVLLGKGKYILYIRDVALTTKLPFGQISLFHYDIPEFFSLINHDASVQYHYVTHDNTVSILAGSHDPQFDFFLSREAIHQRIPFATFAFYYAFWVIGYCVLLFALWKGPQVAVGLLTCARKNKSRCVL